MEEEDCWNPLKLGPHGDLLPAKGPALLAPFLLAHVGAHFSLPPLAHPPAMFPLLPLIVPNAKLCRTISSQTTSEGGGL